MLAVSLTQGYLVKWGAEILLAARSTLLRKLQVRQKIVALPRTGEPAAKYAAAVESPINAHSYSEY